MSGHFQCNFCPAISYTRIWVGSPILSHPQTIQMWLCSQVSLLVHLGALSLSLSGFFASPTSSTPKYTLSTTNKRSSCLILIAITFSSLSSSRCLWYWMLKSSSSVWSIHCTPINQFGYLCGASYPSSKPLLSLIYFEALQSLFNHSMQCFVIQDTL